MSLLSRLLRLGKLEDDTQNVVARTTSLEGVLKSDGDLKVYGSFEGQIETVGDVLVGAEASVTADISARNVVVAGILRGNVTALEQVRILSSGQLHGDIVSGQLRIEEGGLFAGHSQMHVEGSERLYSLVGELEERNGNAAER